MTCLALPRDQLLMVIPLPLHFLRNLLLGIIMSCQFGVHLRQGRVLNEVLELEEGVRIGFGKEGNGCTEFSSSTCSTNSVRQCMTNYHSKRRLTCACIFPHHPPSAN